MKLTFAQLLSGYLAFFAAVFCVFPELTSLILVGLTGIIVYGYFRKELTFRWSPVFTVMIVLYGSFLVGTFWSMDMNEAAKSMEYKLSFIVFPLLFSATPKEKLNTGQILRGWLIGLTIATLMGIGFGIAKYSETGVSSHLFTVFISPIHHPTYFSAFHAFTIVLIWWAHWKKLDGFKLWWVIPFTLLSIIYHGMMLSLAGVLFLMALISVMILIAIYRQWGRWILLAALVLTPVVSVYVLRNVPYIEGEWNSAYEQWDKFSDNPEAFMKGVEEPISGNEIRLILWTVSIWEIRDHPLGIGTANTKVRLQQRLEEMGLFSLAKRKLDPHNQYLQTGVELGMAGIILILALVGISIWIAIRDRNTLLLVISLSLLFNCLFESMLQRQSGIVFYIFWMSLLCHYPLKYIKNRSGERLSASS